MSDRLVVVLCGPPGAGKTTAARSSGLEVFDRDDPQWSGESDFRQALAELARDRTARAVVIRSGATSSARAKAAQLVNATHVFVLLADEAELKRRVRARGRADLVTGIASVPRWLTSFDRIDGVSDFPGWDSLAPVDLSVGIRSREW